MATKKKATTKKKKEADNERRIQFRHRGKKYDVGVGDLNAIEIRDFRREVGIPFGHLTIADFDLDVIATIIWLVDRRGKPQLTWEDVAEELSYDDIAQIAANEQADEDEEPEDSSEEDPSESGDDS